MHPRSFGRGSRRRRAQSAEGLPRSSRIDATGSRKDRLDDDARGGTPLRCCFQGIRRRASSWIARRTIQSSPPPPPPSPPPPLSSPGEGEGELDPDPCPGFSGEPVDVSTSPDDDPLDELPPPEDPPAGAGESVPGCGEWVGSSWAVVPWSGLVRRGSPGGRRGDGAHGISGVVQVLAGHGEGGEGEGECDAQIHPGRRSR